MQKIKLPIKKNKEDNIKPSNPDFGWLGKMIIITASLLIISYLFFYLFSYLIIGTISLEKEKELFGDLGFKKGNIININETLYNKIININNINIYLEENEEVNAFAFIGGNIILTSGLLKNIDSEEELIFIIGHELEHINNRDSLKILLTDIPFYLTLQYMGFEFNEKIINVTSTYSSKQTEINADNGGIKLINKMGLNLNCSLNFFEKDNGVFDNYLQFVSSHPTNINRIKNIKEQNKNPEKKCTPFVYQK